VKFVAFLAVVAAALLTGHRAVNNGRPGSTASLAGVVVALQAVVITYGGWQSALYFSEEDRDPRANIPRSMIGGVLSVMGVYLLVNLALLVVLPIQELSRSTLPAADAARVLVGPAGQQVVTILSLVSLPPMLNAIMMIATRILFAMGRDGLVWSRTGSVNAGGSPIVATLVTSAVALGLILTGTFQRLVAITAFFLALNYAVCCVAQIVLRRREPTRPRPFLAWGYPWSTIIVLIGAFALVVGTVVGDTVNAALAIGLLVAGLGTRAVVRRSSRNL